MIQFLLVAVVLGILALAILFRAFAGPTAPDRLVALDTIATLVVVAMLSLGAFYKRAVYIDIAIVFSLLSFIGTLYIAKYLEGRL